ncbi:MAG: hypothetical protein AB7P40_25045 [Chloroflexota bacterium]
MASRTRTEAVNVFLSRIQRQLSCVTHDVVRVHGSYQAPDARIDVYLAGGQPVRLQGPERIHLRVRLRLQLTQVEESRGYWDADLAAYEYRLSDPDDREILAYHWHPDGQSHVQTPHLHLGVAAAVGRVALLTAHLPTGQVSARDVVRLAVESFAVQPQRRDWAAILG